MKNFHYPIFILLVAFCLPASLFAAPPADPPELLSQLTGDNPADRQTAVVYIQKLLDSDQSYRAINLLRIKWIKVLMDAKRYDEVQDICRRAILAIPFETNSIEFFLQNRIRALLKSGKPDQALAHAKSLYNICSMTNTASSMLLLAECLNAVHPNDDSYLDKFRSEQIAGATTQPAQSASGRPSVLEQIKVVAAEYAPVIENWTGEDFASLVSRGNLLLLADQPAAAMKVFDRAYGLAPASQLSQATENIARCMKAQDGNIGRANAFVLSLRLDSRHSSKGKDK